MISFPQCRRNKAVAEVTTDSYTDPILKDIASGKYSHEVITDEGAKERAAAIIKEDGYKLTYESVMRRFERGDALDKNDIAKKKDRQDKTCLSFWRRT